MDVPDGWQLKNLGDLAALVTSGSRGWASYYSEAGARFVRITNLSRGSTSIDLSEMKHVSLPDDATEGRRTRLEPNDILLSITADLGLVGLVPNDLGEAYVNQHLALVRLSGDESDPGYVATYLTGADAQRELWRANDAGAKAGLNLQNIRSIPLLLPPIGEQRKIAAILSSVDEAIEKTQAVIDQVQVVKKGLMQELLTRGFPGRHKKFKQTEIGEIPASWEVVELHEVALVRSGIAKNKKNTGDLELPYLRVANVQDGYVDLRELKTIRVEAEALRRFALRAGDVLFTEGGDADKLGRGAVWEGAVSPCLHQNHVFAVAPQTDRLDPWFLSHFGSSDRGKEYFLNAAKQTTNLASINSTQLKRLRIPLPSLDEQKNIVFGISLVQDRLTTEAAVLARLKSLKQALMSVLLTGEIRVAP